jgi:hypothetical protein
LERERVLLFEGVGYLLFFSVNRYAVALEVLVMPSKVFG